MSTPRPEYPRPQFTRSEWLNLNGTWQFEFDPSDSGLERGLGSRSLAQTIAVPFCPEAALSGIGDTDFHRAVWYRREVNIPPEWAGRRILLHFQAVDYDATVWANGTEVARHRGGFTPFTADLTGIAAAGQAVTIVVRARDYHDRPLPSGKQSRQYGNYGCMYTRTTGIWQTVWLEPVADVHFLRPRITPDVTNARFHLELPLSAAQRPQFKVRATLLDQGEVLTQVEIPADLDFSPQLDLAIPAGRVKLWQPGAPHLYDITLELIAPDGSLTDKVQTYAGLRSISRQGRRILINGQPVFQRLVLDQGYYPNGILTAPTDEALVKDIELSLAAGFNGARLHQKVFEERFLYHADRLGYLVWGEFPDWGCGGFGQNDDHQQPTAAYITQWTEAIERDYSHPAIVGWCPLNETWQSITDRISTLSDVTRGMFLAAKALDTTRPVLDASGYSHLVPEADVYDSHDYEQNVEAFRTKHGPSPEWQPFVNVGWRDLSVTSIAYRGQPYFVSEFGGIWWNPNAKPGEDSWGYGNRPQSLDEFYTRLEGLCNALLDNPMMFGYCYTQLTDVYQEQNGFYTFDRLPKFDVEKLKRIQNRQAAYEAAHQV
jgi:beta-galactosidase/beta-glucuronidase